MNYYALASAHRMRRGASEAATKVGSVAASTAQEELSEQAQALGDSRVSAARDAPERHGGYARCQISVLAEGRPKDVGLLVSLHAASQLQLACGVFLLLLTYSPALDCTITI